MIAVFAASYLVGSLNSAIIVTYLLKRKDIREYGSFNAGLTNVYRCFGPVTAAVTLIMDLMKGVVVVFGTRAVCSLSIFDGFPLDTLSVCMMSTLFAVLGHCFPVFYRFKGGKGIAATAGMILAFHPYFIPVAVVVFFGIFFTTHYVSLGSLVLYIVFMAEMVILGQNGVFHMAQPYLNELYAVSAALTVMAFYKHRENIVRLLHGTERKTYLTHRDNDGAGESAGREKRGKHG